MEQSETRHTHRCDCHRCVSITITFQPQEEGRAMKNLHASRSTVRGAYWTLGTVTVHPDERKYYLPDQAKVISKFRICCDNDAVPLVDADSQLTSFQEAAIVLRVEVTKITFSNLFPFKFYSFKKRQCVNVTKLDPVETETSCSIQEHYHNDCVHTSGVS